MINQTLLSICSQLAKQGKTPSVGLVKARAKSNFHLAEIISAVQYWKNNPDWEGNIVEAPEEVTNEIDLNEEDSEQIAQLKQKIASLEDKMSVMENKMEAILAQIGDR